MKHVINPVVICTIPTIDSGSLFCFEGMRDLPFEIKRIYYITGVQAGMERGRHAHKNLQQFLFCPYGEVLLKLDNGSDRENITLCEPSHGVIITGPVWRDLLWKKSNSVLCVAASDYYCASDYIRDYQEFINYITNKILAK